MKRRLVLLLVVAAVLAVGIGYPYLYLKDVATRDELNDYTKNNEVDRYINENSPEFGTVEINGDILYKGSYLSIYRYNGEIVGLRYEKRFGSTFGFCSLGVLVLALPLVLVGYVLLGEMTAKGEAKPEEKGEAAPRRPA